MTALLAVLLLAGSACTVAAILIATGDHEQLGHVVAGWWGRR